MSLILAQLAQDVGVNERTLRRAAATGLIRAPRASARQLSLSGAEERWVRSHWPLVGRLRGTLRTEPNVTLAVLFGSAARGDDIPDVSDVDLLVELHDSSPVALVALRGRLTGRLGANVQIVGLQSAQRDPQLMVEILRDGRPLVDRGDTWEQLRAGRTETRRQAALAQRALHDEALGALDYFRRLAAQRPSPATNGMQP